MRYYIIFGITIVTVCLIIFYPKRYLQIYNDQVIIDYSELAETENELWSFEASNDNLKLISSLEKTWTFEANKNGNVSLIYYYDKKDDSEKYKIEYKFRIKGSKIYWIYGHASGLLDFPNPE